MNTLLLTVENEVATVTLNRPDVRNAFSQEMIQDLTQAFAEVSQNESLAAVVLKGAGPSFSAGADLNWMKSMVGFSMEENVEDSRSLFNMFKTIYDCPIPIIGAVQGHAMGGGVGLVSVCDIVGATRETKFAFSEVKLGLVPAVISPFIMRKMTRSAALELMLTGESFSAERALDHRLVQFVGTSDEVDDYVFGKCDLLRMAGRNAVRDTKRLIRKTAGDFPDDLVDSAINTIANRRVSSEGQEGLSAFLEKRKPNWKQ